MKPPFDPEQLQVPLPVEDRPLTLTDQELDDLAGGYRVVEAQRDRQSLEQTLNTARRRGWRLVSTLEGFGVTNLILYKEPS